jgi:hypothetical protein
MIRLRLMPDRNGANNTFLLYELVFYKNALKTEYNIELQIRVKNGEYTLCETN